jgi:hypothetical protein
MRDPLDQEPARRRKLIELLAHAGQITGRCGPEFAMDCNPRSGRCIGAGRTPHMYFVALPRQAFSYQTSVVAHAARLRRVFTDDVPGESDDLPFFIRVD